jgi:hypothetical protein
MGSEKRNFFSEEESTKELIERVLSQDNAHQLRKAALFFIAFIFVGPFFKGRRSEERLIEIVGGYWWAVCYLTIILIVCFIWAKVSNDVKLEQNLKDIKKNYSVKNESLIYVNSVKRLFNYDTLVFKNTAGATVNLKQTSAELKKTLKENTLFNVVYLENEKMILKIGEQLQL